MASFVSSNIKKSFRTVNKKLDTLMKVSKSKKITGKAEVSIDFNDDVFEDALALMDAFPDAAAKAFYFSMKIVCNDLLAELDEAMESPVWQWSDGQNRDIIDTRKLQESGRVEFDPVTNAIVVSYDTDYAEIVHYGGVIQSPLNPNVDIVYPARPWVEAVVLGGGPVPVFDFQSSFNAVFFSALERNLGIKL